MATEPEVQISHLQRRMIEGRVLIPFIEACRERFGDAATQDLVRTTVERFAAKDGQAWAAEYGSGLPAIRRVFEEVWAGDGSLDIHSLGETENWLDLNVTRCGYAQFYRELGLAEIGFLVHCCRDHAVVSSFDSSVELERTQTIMQGASHCDFRFRKKSTA